MERTPKYEFIYYPEFGEIEKTCPATKIVHTLYSPELTKTEMQEAFIYFLKACSYHFEEDECE